jgi:hypothetical protein
LDLVQDPILVSGIREVEELVVEDHLLPIFD